MTRPHARPLLTAAAIALGIALAGCAGTTDTSDTLPTADDLGVEAGDEPMTSGMCAQDQPDCQDTVVDEGGTAAGGGAAAGSCLAGDEDCTDESYGGQDVTRPILLVDAIDDIRPAERGATSGATGHPVQQAVLVDEDTVQLVVIGSECMLVEDVLVTESPAEVRVLVLGGQDAAIDACEDESTSWVVEVDLAEPLGDRALLDLAD